VPPVLVTQVTDADGTVIYQNHLGGIKAVDPYVADTVSGVLQQVIERGTGTAAKFGRPAAGKTGTGEDYKNAWFCGYTPTLSTSVWVGFPTEELTMAPPRTSITVYGGTWPAEIWKRFMSAALSDTAPSEFRPPGPAPTTSTVPPPPPQPRDVVLGPDETVPGVIGMDYDSAVGSLRSAGFQTYRVKVAGRGPPGTVLRQAPTAGDDAPTGSTVTVEVVADDDTPASVAVPNVIGLSPEAAVRAIQQVGLVAVTNSASVPDNIGVNHGDVWLMNPAAGSVVNVGATVTIVVAS
jgi:penicillin-binding protein 1A